MKLPEPFLLFDTQQKTVHFLIPTRIDVPMTVAIEPMKLYSEAQLKQAVSDALEAAAKVCESIADEYQRREGLKYPELKSDAETGASKCEAEIRKLMEGL